MARTIRALLVGIDRYRPPVPPLSGCINDVDAFAEFLQGRVGGDGASRLEMMVLRDSLATRYAVIGGFREHLAQAGPDDVALFYYAGHGSQAQSPPETWPLEPDHLDETLVLYDSREPGNFDLADKELAALLDEVAARGAHVVVILDCCHSGSGTRDFLDAAMPVRRAPTDLRPRPIGTFLGDPTTQGRRRAAGDGPTTSWPVGKHVLLAACRDDQEASEYPGDGRPRGAFSYFLGDTLRQASGPLTYRDLFGRTAAMLRASVRNQSPQLESAAAGALDALFLDGAIRPGDPSYLVTRDGPDWRLDAGAVHGLVVGQEVAIFPFDAPPELLREAAKSVARGRLVEVGAATARVDLDRPPKAGVAFKAVATGRPLPPLTVAFEGEPGGLATLRRCLVSSGFGGAASPYVREAREGDSPDYRLIARDDRFVIARPADARPVVAPTEGLDPASARRTVARLEHIARWSAALGLANPSSMIRLGADPEIGLTILQGDRELAGDTIRLAYERRDGEWVAPTFRLRLRNLGKRRLHVAVAVLTESFEVATTLQDGGSTALDPGQETWAFRGEPIPATVPDELQSLGVVEVQDVLKLIVSTAPFDVRLMEQPALDLPLPEPWSTRSAPGSLDALLGSVRTRALGRPDGPSRLDDWAATQLVFTTVRPRDAVALDAARPATLAAGVTLQPHPALTANARLTAAPTAARDLGNLALPRLLRDDPTIARPFELTTTRSGSPDLGVLELTDVANRGAVTPDAPLRLDVPATLAAGEHVLPIAFDGEFFLPLGHAEARAGGGTTIVIERLPGEHGGPALPDAAKRSLSGSIRIFFRKVARGVLARPFEYPILAAADVDGSDGEERVVYEADARILREKVAASKSILLLIHGITGDSLEMRRGLRRAKVDEAGTPLDAVHDLVLTLDYENLNTPIEEVARSLKGRLEAIGLGPDHGKPLTIVAHSMGGLVARWFIEREGGSRVVTRLLMCGTPNGGSPWPDVHDWALGLLALGLNGLATVAWPASILGGLVAAIERVDVNMDQLQAGSPFLKELARSRPTGVPYRLLAGDTSLTTAGLVIDRDGLSPAARLLSRLLGKPALAALADTLFRDAPNDIAVSVASMKAIPGRWEPDYDVRPVACDHMSYFRHPAGLEALARALG